MRKAGINAEKKKPNIVYYEGENFGEFEADILVENAIILELKSVRQLAKAHEVQLINYLVATGKDVGLLLNFGEEKVDVKRKVRELNQYSRQTEA
ncbi:MAG: GxxExxY protein [candidate division KSB1 bacterium]|nr:GxxExxY protein [candidate division KSB1 bacterium]MDZ7403553.1 GxxExxY protein [candidate division KSB1 bacterium]